MNTLLSNGLNELEKLMVKRTTKLFLIFAAALPILIKLLVHKLFITNWMSLPTDNINFSILDLYVNIFLPLYIFIAATVLFTGEKEQGTLFPVLPISRLELYITKTFAICLMIGIQLFTVSVTLMVSNVIFDQSFQLKAILSVLGAFFVSWVPLIVLTAIAILLAQFFNSSAIAVSSMIFLYFVMIVLPYAVPNVLYFFPTSYFDWYMQWFGNMSIRWLIQSITYLCSSFTLFFITGYYIFNKKEA
jgi:ABC-2 type transport system permease protein